MDGLVVLEAAHHQPRGSAVQAAVNVVQQRLVGAARHGLADWVRASVSGLSRRITPDCGMSFTEPHTRTRAVGAARKITADAVAHQAVACQ